MKTSDNDGRDEAASPRIDRSAIREMAVRVLAQLGPLPASLAELIAETDRPAATGPKRTETPDSE